MVPLLLVLGAVALEPASPVTLTRSEWTTWAPRPEIAPRTFLDDVHQRTPQGALAISGNSNPAAYGGWHYRVGDVQPRKWYRLTAYYRTEGVPNTSVQVLARVDWTKTDGKRAGQPEYAWSETADGAWTRVQLDAPAPAEAAGATLQLYLANAPLGTVWWDEISFEPVQDPGARNAIVATVNLSPQRTKGAADSVRQFVETVDREVSKADLILLPEGITVVGTGLKYGDVAEAIPGPTTATLGELAKRKNSYIAAGIYEREGAAIYNTSVLIDRAGRVAGKYRKVYIPREEYEGGITPGSDYPVFRTDFGRIGMMICWDVQYADPARLLALGGAEIILLPIWGGNDTLAKARAIENHVFLVSSGYGHPTRIIDPDGEVLAVASDRGKVAIATLDLNKRYVDPWLGDMRARFRKELRLDVSAR